MSDSLWPHRRQPTRLPCPWDSPDKNTGVGCHFLLQCTKVKSESEVASHVWLGVTSPQFQAALIAQLVKNHLQCKRPRFNSWVRKIHWRRERLPTPVFLGFTCDSVCKESACNVGDLGLIRGLGKSPGEGKGYPLPVFWPGEFHGLYSPWGHKELDMTEQISLSLSPQLSQSSVGSS